MARYQVFRNQDGEGYLLDVQNEFLEDLEQRLLKWNHLDLCFGAPDVVAQR